jgi:hypothetical protein
MAHPIDHHEGRISLAEKFRRFLLRKSSETVVLAGIVLVLFIATAAKIPYAGYCFVFALFTLIRILTKTSGLPDSFFMKLVSQLSAMMVQRLK